MIAGMNFQKVNVGAERLMLTVGFIKRLLFPKASVAKISNSRL